MRIATECARQGLQVNGMMLTLQKPSANHEIAKTNVKKLRRKVHLGDLITQGASLIDRLTKRTELEAVNKKRWG